MLKHGVLKSKNPFDLLTVNDCMCIVLALLAFQLLFFKNLFDINYKAISDPVRPECEYITGKVS